MNAILHSYDDVKELIPLNDDFIQRMGGRNYWNANPATFNEMRNKGVDVATLLGVFIQSPKIPFEIKKRFAFKCAQRVVGYFSPKIKINVKRAALKVLEIAPLSDKVPEQYKKAISDFQYLGQPIASSNSFNSDRFALAVVVRATDPHLTLSDVYASLVYGGSAACLYGGKKASDKESEMQLDDIIELTELKNPVEVIK